MTRTTGPAALHTRESVNLPPREWMREGLCAQPLHRTLPWIGEGNTHAARRLTPVMRELCGWCPVATECAAFVEAAGIDGGFWAGQWRQPDMSFFRRRQPGEAGEVA